MSMFRTEMLIVKIQFCVFVKGSCLGGLDEVGRALGSRFIKQMKTFLISVCS